MPGALGSAFAHDLVEQCLRGLATGEPLCSDIHGSRYPVHYHYLAHPDHGDLARGLVWAAALAGGASAVPSLTALAVRTGGPRSDVAQDLKLAGAALNALGDIDDPSALEALWRLQAKIKDRGLRKQLDIALRAAAERQGITPGQLVERSVPAHGRGAGGSQAWKLGDHEATVVIEDPVTVRLAYAAADGRALRSAPTTVRESHAEWRACLYHENADEDADYAPDYAATDQVRFERRDGRQWRETPLDEVPPIVFGEAMRDVDLFVGVTSIAADPDWDDRGEDRFGGYCRTASFAELTGSAEVRRDVLKRIIPKTRIGGRCSVDGRFLVVRGALRTYERLALILSKAFLLADDAGITDATVLQQIKRGT
ncbi:hypothetical protein [Actinomadura sp. HBU206391]|uniref:DUF7737 domain-containing protein n=1 Tax=Actinomadura sp. HBU206391 TaxID=2731692 RepID=UPI00164F4EBD|nr:hypothetical protein [Actinomadura sp. HBU206391]MBC6460395.1 hypothetical protein [Actinomadura sp. HBU206391]